MSTFIEWSALGQVVVAGLVVGAGIPAVFALGLRLLTAPVPDGVVDGVATGPGPARRIAGMVCIGVAVAAVLVGIAFLVSGGH